MPGPNRSVVDFDSEDELRKALMAVRLPSGEGFVTADLKQSSSDMVADDDEELKDTANNADDPADNRAIHQAGPGEDNLDWVLPSYDAATTDIQSMKEELHRLQVLKSYLILDADREESFERITGLASRIYNVPIALISLVDLGRQWFMSNRGLGDVRETPRKYAFCAHTILNKHNILIVPDATKDFRFMSNPLVTGPPHIRFYAGAPLVSPEGYKLGTLCIIDATTRPAGLSQDDQANLRDFADMAVKELVDRRYRFQTQETPAQLIAYTAHDLMTPLTGVQLSLSLLKDDENIRAQLGPHHLELLVTASNCSDLMLRICQTAIDTLRRDSLSMPVDLTQPSLVPSSNNPVTKMAELVKSLSMITESIPKTVPLIITLDPAVPPNIVCDDLKLFRSALNLLTNASERTTLGFCHLRIFTKNHGRTLAFECSDSGTPVSVEEYPYLFRPGRTDEGGYRLGLSSVASLIHALDGEYGFRPRGVAAERTIVSEKDMQQGAVFWFSVPLQLPNGQSDFGGSRPTVNKKREFRPLKAPVIPVFMRRSNSNTSISSLEMNRVPVIVDDPFQAHAVAESCLGECYEPSIIVRQQRSTLDQKMPATANGHDGRNMLNLNRNGAGYPEIAVNVASSSTQDGRRRRRALVVDDSSVVRKSIAIALQKMEFDVWQAADGLEGLKVMTDTIFDLVLMDFLMPVMDGMDCVMQFREWEKQNRPNVRACIVGISAHANANDTGQGIRAGMDDFRAKPITVSMLREIEELPIVKETSKLLDRLESTTETEGASEDIETRKRGEAPNGDISDPVFYEASTKRPKVTTMPTRTLSNTLRNFETLVCLMATDTPTLQSNLVLTGLEQQGWKVVVVHDGDDAVRLLKMRNWDFVLIDDDIPLVAGAPSVARFRAWEEENRVNKQRNMLLVCSGEIPSPSDKSSIVHGPPGVDGVLRKPVVWGELEFLIGKSYNDNFEHVVRRQASPGDACGAA